MLPEESFHSLRQTLKVCGGCGCRRRRRRRLVAEVGSLWKLELPRALSIRVAVGHSGITYPGKLFCLVENLSFSLLKESKARGFRVSE